MDSDSFMSLLVKAGIVVIDRRPSFNWAEFNRELEKLEKEPTEEEKEKRREREKYALANVEKKKRKNRNFVRDNMQHLLNGRNILQAKT